MDTPKSLRSLFGNFFMSFWEGILGVFDASWGYLEVIWQGGEGHLERKRAKKLPPNQKMSDDYLSSIYFLLYLAT